MKKSNIYIIVCLIFVFNVQIYGSQVWRSLIIPGWGEKKLNHNKVGNALLFTEYGLWAVYLFSNHQTISYRNDYKNHGSFYAGIDWSHKNNLYAANAGNYNSLEEYNEIKAREFLYNHMYPTDGEINYNWDWSSREERLKYDTWRNKSKNYNEKKGFLIAGMLINRIISILDIVILERKSRLNSEFIKSGDNSMQLNIYYEF